MIFIIFGVGKVVATGKCRRRWNHERRKRVLCGQSRRRTRVFGGNVFAKHTRRRNTSRGRFGLRFRGNILLPGFTIRARTIAATRLPPILPRAGVIPPETSRFLPNVMITRRPRVSKH